MCDKANALENNPFAYLFPTLEEAKKYSREAAAKLVNDKINLNVQSPESGPSTSNRDDSNQNPNDAIDGEGRKTEKKRVLTKEERINKTAEHVFGITLNKNTDKPLVFLEEFVSEYKQIDVSNLEQILFERLLLEEPAKSLIGATNSAVVDSHILQTEVITYLIECHKKLNNVRQIKKNEEIKDEIQNMQMLILRNAATALRQPELYENQDLNSQVLQIFYDNQNPPNEEVTSFFSGIVEELLSDTETPDIVQKTFAPIFDFVHKKIVNSNLINFEHVVIFSFLQVMAGNTNLAHALISHSNPKNTVDGRVYSNTLLGAIFCLSCLPKENDGPYEYFDSPDIHTTKAVEDTVWTSLKCICDNLHQLFLTLLKSPPTVKDQTLMWLANCLASNCGRGKLGGSEQPADRNLGFKYVSDGFMLNLSAVLLRLCQPFITDFNSPKILKIDPRYCAAKGDNPEDAQEGQCHSFFLHRETCLLPTEEGEERSSSGSFNFITQCYFLAQKSLDLGFRTCAQKVKTLVQELAEIQRAYNDAVAMRGANNEVSEHIQERLQAYTSKYLSLRTALLEPKTLDLLCKLHATSASWLIQILLNVDDSNSEFGATVMKPLVIPLPEGVPVALKYIPEFILENLTCFLSFIKRYNRRTFEENGFEWLDPILSVTILFMETPKRISNPHLRAALGKAMEALLPNNDDDDMSMNPIPVGTICRSQLFKQHPLSKLIVPNLLNLFVSIEITGQNLHFEEKFYYRRPIYVIMDYLWTNEEHRTCFKNLAQDAEKNMETVTPPLFLRFLNLLINDAVFLLDEALSNMAQLKTMQAARESGEWAKLPLAERVQNETLFQGAGMLAKFNNILGRWTIHTLEFLTSEIKSIFWHPVLMDRVAGMLNYFLHTLVGPNKKNFKVKDKNEYDFKPDVFVMDICKIYTHLYESDAFCLAISQDGRSYNAELFQQAQDVLARIGGGTLIGELKAVEEKVSSIASRHSLEEELLPEIPEEFLDPIMSTLMKDPVILPSSRQVVDRTTIARHLLSDESDPFNRSPLTLDKVISHEELRARIENWLKERKKPLEDRLADEAGASAAPPKSD